MPWILLTGMDLIPKVLKVLVSMSISETHPKKMNINQGESLRPAEILSLWQAPRGSGKTRRRHFLLVYHLRHAIKEATSRQTDRSVPWICHA